MDTVRSLLPSIRAAIAQKSPTVSALLQQAKLASLEFPSQQSMDGSVVASVEETSLTRELLEVSITSSVPTGDWQGFELQLAQLLPLYSAGGAGESEATKESRRLVTGLQLMHLLVEARLSDFHCRVETLQEADIAHPLIAFPLKLEATLLEGGYNKVREAARAAWDYPPLFSPSLSASLPSLPALVSIYTHSHLHTHAHAHLLLLRSCP